MRWESFKKHKLLTVTVTMNYFRRYKMALVALLSVFQRIKNEYILNFCPCLLWVCLTCSPMWVLHGTFEGPCSSESHLCYCWSWRLSLFVKTFTSLDLMSTHFLLLELDAPSGFQMDCGPFNSLPPLPNCFVFSFQACIPQGSILSTFAFCLPLFLQNILSCDLDSCFHAKKNRSHLMV